MFSSKSLIVLVLAFRSLVHFELTFACEVRVNFSHSPWLSRCPASLVEDFFSPI